LPALAKSKGVKLKIPPQKLGVKAKKVQSQTVLAEVLRDNKDSFVVWGFDTSATAEVVKFDDLKTNAQVYYVDTQIGYTGPIKISYRAQLPKDRSIIEIDGKGTIQEKGPGQATPQVSPTQSVKTNEPEPTKDSKNRFGLMSFHVQNLKTAVPILSYNALRSPIEGTSMLKLFIGLAIKKEVLANKYSLSSTWSGTTIAVHLSKMLGEESSNTATNDLIGRLGGINNLNSIIKSLGFTRTGLKTVYGKITPASELINLSPTNSIRYSTEAKAAGYLEPYGEAPSKTLHPSLTSALTKMRQASGFSLQIISGFRSFSAQEKIWLGKPPATRADFSAPPGYSQHHTGLAVDLASAGSAQVQLAWLRANATRYGFMFPYLNTTGDLGPGPEPWHLVWVGNAAAMAVFHDFISRAKSLGFDPFLGDATLEALYRSPASLDTDKDTCNFDLCGAMALIQAGTDPVSVVMKKALKGAFVGIDGESASKVGFTSKVFGCTIVVDDQYILSAYAQGPESKILKAGVRALAKTLLN
jgi:hypothetical protein